MSPSTTRVTFASNKRLLASTVLFAVESDFGSGLVVIVGAGSRVDCSAKVQPVKALSKSVIAKSFLLEKTYSLINLFLILM